MSRDFERSVLCKYQPQTFSYFIECINEREKRIESKTESVTFLPAGIFSSSSVVGPSHPSPTLDNYIIYMLNKLYNPSHLFHLLFIHLFTIHHCIGKKVFNILSTTCCFA